MNLGRKITLYLLLCIGLCGVAFSQTVDIPDQNLEQAIRETLELPANAPLLTTHMQSLNRLAAGQRGITDLTGLEHAANLTALWLTRNEISDISPLAGLTQLEVLSVADNPLRDLAPVANLTRLTYLGIIGCPVTDLRPLAPLTRLEQLYAHNCDISDIAPLAGLTQLTRLHLAANRIVDISALANLTELVYLQLARNRIVDISALANLRALEILRLEHNRIVDISALANLTNLRELAIHGNSIVDYSPISGLALTDFHRDEECEVPGLPVQERIENRSLPSIFLPWDDGILNRGGDWWDDSIPYYERVVSHDLWWRGVRFELSFRLTPEGYQIAGNLAEAVGQREELLSANPNMLILVDLRQKYAPIDRFPENWFGWVRDENGNPMLVDEHDPHSQIQIDFRRPEVQDVIVQRALAVAKCGLYDGIMFDAWGGDDFSVLRKIREGVPDNFLILFNTNRRKIPLSIPYINGGFMETFPRVRENGYTRDDIIEIESNLIWYEVNAREPKINCLRGFGIGAEPPDSPNNRRWMRLFTTMGLTLSDGYALYTVGTIGGQKQFQKHIWHSFWDADLGQPVGQTAQRYRDIEGLYIREFTNGWAVYNRSGTAQIITLPQKAQAVRSGLSNTEHAVPDLDGDIFLKVIVVPGDLNGDKIVNILDLIIVAQAMGTYNAAADVNGDGVINVFDLVFVANQF